MTDDAGDVAGAGADESVWRRPEAGNPEPDNPEPGNPEPGNPEPGNPEPDNPEPDSPEPARRPEPPRRPPARPTEPAAGMGNPWRRPDAAAEPARTPPGRPPSEPYAGPPPTQPPPRGWRPPLVVRAPDPRELPPQDLDGIARDERSARTLTLGIGMLAGAVTLIVTCLLCSRILL